MTDRFKAGDDRSSRSPEQVGGSGGGRPDFAQAGAAATPRQLDAALATRRKHGLAASSQLRLKIRKLSSDWKGYPLAQRYKTSRNALDIWYG